MYLSARVHVHGCADSRLRAHFLCLCLQQLHQMLELHFRCRGHELKHGEPSCLPCSSLLPLCTRKHALGPVYWLSLQAAEEICRKKSMGKRSECSEYTEDNQETRDHVRACISKSKDLSKGEGESWSTPGGFETVMAH